MPGIAEAEALATRKRQSPRRASLGPGLCTTTHFLESAVYFFLFFSLFSGKDFRVGSQLGVAGVERGGWRVAGAYAVPHSERCRGLTETAGHPHSF